MINVVLNVYKRPHTLKRQIEAVLAQSVEVKPENIHVWYNEAGVKKEFSDIPGIKTYIASWNTKFWGRFTLPLLFEPGFVAIFDDDIIPEKNWLKNCMDSYAEKPGIYGGSGIFIMEDGKYFPKKRMGWNGAHLDRIQEVDLVGHAWFFNKDVAKYLWYEEPLSFDNGEDIMFSFLARKYGGVRSYVPPHPDSDRSLWSTSPESGRKLGCDKNASWRREDHSVGRDKIVKYYHDRGFKRVGNGG